MFRLLILLFFFLSACKVNTPKTGTPPEFVNSIIPDSSMYAKDKMVILDSLYEKMKNHQASFSNPEYFDSTELSVDTILYDTSFNKIAVFVVSKNPTYRNPYSDSKLPFYYNGNCYIGKRTRPDLNMFDLKCLCRFSEVNFNDKQTTIRALQDDFFYELATVLDENSQPVFRYNLNDKRFWESPTGWKSFFD